MTCNAASIGGFVCAVVLNIEYLGGSTTCIFFLAPLLLLLTRDRYLFSELEEKNRYFPILAACSLFLSAVSINTLWLQRSLASLGLVSWSSSEQVGWAFLVRNTIFLLLECLVHWHVYNYYRTFARQSQFKWLLLLPLNLFALFSDLTSIQLLGLLGAGASVLQFWYWYQSSSEPKNRNTI